MSNVIIKCPSCGKDWNIIKFNACECGAVMNPSPIDGKPVISNPTPATTGRGEEGRTEIIIREPTETEKFLEKELSAAYAEIEGLQKERDDYREMLIKIISNGYAAPGAVLKLISKYPNK